VGSVERNVRLLILAAMLLGEGNWISESCTWMNSHGVISSGVDEYCTCGESGGTASAGLECIQERVRNARYLKSDSSNKLL
jgi:hypothetical protein